MRVHNSVGSSGVKRVVLELAAVLP
jgi:hypothetical protein